MPTESEIVQRLTRVETFIQEIRENELVHIRGELEWIRERLNRGYRPPWSVVSLVAFLSASCVGLLVALVK